MTIEHTSETQGGNGKGSEAFLQIQKQLYGDEEFELPFSQAMQLQDYGFVTRETVSGYSQNPDGSHTFKLTVPASDQGSEKVWMCTQYTDKTTFTPVQ